MVSGHSMWDTAHTHTRERVSRCDSLHVYRVGQHDQGGDGLRAQHVAHTHTRATENSA
jgi:hypothetical protein